MFEIQLSNTDVSSGSVPISWCVDMELLKKLSDHGVKNPAVVIIVAPEGDADNKYHIYKEWRNVVPLKDLMAYVSFRYPGKTKIWAFVSHMEYKDAKGRWLSKVGTDWVDHALNYWGESFAYDEPDTQATPITIDVPEQCFAAEPPEWEKNWTNYLFLSKCPDQCHYRRRRMFSFTIQPLIMLGSFLWRFLMLMIASLWVSKGLTLKYLNPISYPIGEAFKVLSGGSHLIPKVESFDKELPDFLWKKYKLAPFMPVFLLFALVLVLTHKAAILGAALLIVFIAAVLFVFGVILVSKSDTISEFTSKVRDSLSKIFFADKQELWYMDQEEITTLVCSPDKTVRTLKSLPEKHKTIKLRFADLKSKVCKPFAR